MPKKRRGRLYPRHKKKVRYRYHEGAEPGDERYARPINEGDSSKVRVQQSPFPGPGSTRYDVSDNQKVVYRLHDGAQSPLSTEDTPRYGFTADEMQQRFKDQQERMEVQQNRYEARRERQQREWEKEVEEQKAKKKTQEDVSDVASSLSDSVRAGLSAVPGSLFTDPSDKSKTDTPVLRQAQEFNEAIQGKTTEAAFNQALDDKSVLNRTFDVLSRPLYSIGENIDRQIEQDKAEGTFDKLGSAVRGIGDAGSVLTGKPASGDAYRSTAEGIAGKSKTTPSMVLQEHYGTEGATGFAQGLGADILLDPLTYTPTGPFRAGIQAVKGAARNRRATTPASRGLDEEAAEAPVTPNIYDEMVDPEIPINERVARADRLNEAVAQPAVRQHFDAEAERGMQNLVREGRLTQEESDSVLAARETPDFQQAISNVTDRAASRQATHLKLDDLSRPTPTQTTDPQELRSQFNEVSKILDEEAALEQHPKAAREAESLNRMLDDQEMLLNRPGQATHARDRLDNLKALVPQSRHAELDAPKPSAQAATPDAPGATQGAQALSDPSQARQVVEAATRRGQLNRRLSQRTKAGAEETELSAIRQEASQLNDVVGSAGPAVNAARRSLQNTKGVTGATFRAQEKVVSNANRARNSISTLLAGGSIKGTRASEALRRVSNSTSEKEWEDAVSASLGDETDVIRNDVRNVVNEYTNEVGQRPGPFDQSNLSKADWNEQNRAWHIGMYDAISQSMGRRVTDSLASELPKHASESTIPGSGIGQVAQDAGQSVDNLSERISEGALTSWKNVASEFQRPRPEVIDDLFRDLGVKSRSVEEGIKTQLYEIVAMAGKLPIPEGFSIRIDPSNGKVLTNLTDEWDSFMNQRANLQIPQHAERSYNNFFARLINPSYGVQPQLNEARMRMVGMANDNVAHRVGRLKRSLGRVPRGRRKRQFSQFRAYLQGRPLVREGEDFFSTATGERIEGGLPEDVFTENMDYFLKETDRILSPYASTDFYRNAFGDAGQPNLGDLNRWLPEKYQFPRRADEMLPGVGEVSEKATPSPAERNFDAAFLSWLPDNTDPLDFLWQLDIANEKILAEKALLTSMSDTFGVPRENHLIAQALKDTGYVENKNFGQQMMFHPDVSRQIDKVMDTVHRPKDFSKVVQGIDTVQNLFRRLVTVYNIPAFVVRNLIGDTFVNMTEGMAGPKGVASYNQAIRVMRDHTDFDELTEEAMRVPGATGDPLEGRPSVRATLFKTKKGQDVSSERLYSEYLRRGLSPTQISATMGLSDRTPSAGMARRAILEPIERVTEAGAQMGRISQFIHKVKTSDKPLDDAFNDAADSVRRTLYDYNDFTQFERSIMSRVFPFYKYTRKNMPHMIGLMFTNPGRAMVPDKALRNLSLAQGYEFDEESGELEGQITPSWFSNVRSWPIAEFNGQTIYASPDYQFNTWLRDFGTGDNAAITALTQWGSPLGVLPAEEMTGTAFKFGEYQDVSDEPLHQRALEELPQYRNIKNLMDPGERSEPGRLGQIAGVGTGSVTPSNQMAELLSFRDEFLKTGPGQVSEQIEDAESAEGKAKAEAVEQSMEQRYRNLDALMELIENGK